MAQYQALKRQVFQDGDFSIVPIRREDRYTIMEWRNQQIYHLRQNKPLSRPDQNTYFDKIVAGLFQQPKPDQILFSFLENETCIGYGGLVRINWIDKNAEISFIMATEREEEFFEHHWSVYLRLIEKVAFAELELHKLYVYAFDLRPHLYKTLTANEYFLDARLKEHCYFDGQFLDVVIHSKTKE